MCLAARNIVVNWVSHDDSKTDSRRGDQVQSDVGVGGGLRRGLGGGGGGGCAGEEMTTKEKVVRILKLSGDNFILNYSIN